MDAILMDAFLMDAILMNAILMDAILMDAFLMDENGCLMDAAPRHASSRRRVPWCRRAADARPRPCGAT